MSTTEAPPAPRRGFLLRLLAAIPWMELTGVLLVLGGALALYQLSEFLEEWQLALGGGVLLFLLLGSFRRVWGWLFGPVLFHDLVRSSRQGRHALLRCLYLLLLLVVLFLLYWEFVGTQDPFEFWFGGMMKRSEVPKFTEAFFFVFVSVQFCVAFLLTPIFTAGCIAEEKDRKTLEFLLTTDLGNHEIIFGKVLSRLAALLLLVITGLPVLGILQFLGGVDPNLVLGSFLATGITVLSLASLSVACSVLFARPRTAILSVYVLVAVYLAVTGAIEYLVDPVAQNTGVKFDPLMLPFEGLGGGNFAVAVYRWRHLEDMTSSLFWVGPGAPAPAVTGGPSTALLRVLGTYCGFHLLVILVCLPIAILPLRLISRWESGARGRRSFVLGTKQRRLPRVWNQFLVWKELFAEPLFRFNRTGMVAVATFVTVCLLLGAFFVISWFFIGYDTGQLPTRMNQVVCWLGTFVVCLLLLGIAVRAAGSIGAERDRLTLESLLTTPAENGDIVWAKWLGSVLCGRKLFGYVGFIWLAALVTGGLNILGLVLLVAAFASYAIFCAGLGLWFSLVSRTTTRAYIWTLVTITVLCCSNLILGVLAAPVVALVSPTDDIDDWTMLQSATMVPPYTLVWLSMSDEDVATVLQDRPTSFDEDWRFFSGRQRRGSGWWEGSSRLALVSASLLGLVGYALAGMILWGMTATLFGPVTGRVTEARSPPETPRRKPARRDEPSGAGV